MFGTDLGQKKNKKTKNITKHTQKTQPLLQDPWARQSLQGRGEPGQLARVLLRAHSKEFGVCEEALYRGRKKRRLKSDLSRSVKGRDLFSPLFPLQHVLLEGNLRRRVEGEAGGALFQDHIMLKNLGGLHRSSFKGSF